MIGAVVLVLTIAAFFSPWWSESRQREESTEKDISYVGLSEFSYEELQTEDEYKYVCPHCSDTVAYDEEDLEDRKRYLCPYCDEAIAYNEDYLEYVKEYFCPDCDRRIGYQSESLDDLKEHCPECGAYVGEYATNCDESWYGCGATFSEPVIWCDYCDGQITPVEKYNCYDCGETFENVGVPKYKCYGCDKIFSSPEKKLGAREGDSATSTIPLSHTYFVDAEKEDGIMNKVGVANITYYIWLIGMIASGIAFIAMIVAGINGSTPYIAIISMGVAFLLTLVGVVYFSAAWSGAYDDDWADEHVDEDGNGDEDEPEQVVSGFWGTKRYQPDEDEKYTDYSWGPSSGWIFGLISVGLSFVAAIFLFISKNELRRKTGTRKAKRKYLPTGHRRDERVEPSLSNSYDAQYGKPPRRERRETSPMSHRGPPSPHDQYENSTFRGNASYDDIYNKRPERHRDPYGDPYDRPRQQPRETYDVRKDRFPPPPY